MKIGYARVSTRRQRLAFQIAALEKAGCGIIIAEKISGRCQRKPGLAAALASCGKGDTLVVWKIDRLGRDLLDLVQLVKLLKSAGIGLAILSGRASLIDIATVEGRALYGIFAAFADLEHEFGRQRTLAGVRASRDAGTGTRHDPGTGAIRKQRRVRRKPLSAAFNHVRCVKP